MKRKNNIKNLNQYSNENSHELANLANFANFATSCENPSETSKDQQTAEVLLNTPTIPLEVHETLPRFLKECVEQFDGIREKDVFLTSALGVLSGLFKNVNGQYHNKWVNSNLFIFVLAPAANGKGTMDFSYKLGEFHQKSLLKQNIESQQDYNFKLQQIDKSKSINPDDYPEKPPFKILFIPANCSSAKMQQHLNENDGRGIIFETEADALGNMFGKDWAVPGEIFRKTFHHEPITISRSTNNVYTQNLKSFMAIVLGGTPNQLHKIIPSAEDGLFSRFIFYIFRNNSEWKSPRPNANKPNLTDYFTQKGAVIDQMVAFFDEYPCEIKLNKLQWDEFDATYANLLIKVSKSGQTDAESVVKRMGLILFRFCMIFTALRKFEGKIKEYEMDCHANDFLNAIRLTTVYLEHNLTLLSNLKNTSKFNFKKLPKNIQNLFENLPEEFKRKEAIELGNELGIPERTIDKHLKDAKGDFLDSPKTGFYINKMNKPI